MKDISLNQISRFFLLILCLSSIAIIGSLSIANPNNEPVFIQFLETQYSPELLPKHIETQQRDELDLQTSFFERTPTISSQRTEDPKIPQELIHFSSESHPNLTHVYTDPGFGINAIAVDDFNHDSVPDIAAGAEDLYVFNGATGEFLYINPGWVTTMTLGDLSRDGIPDIVASSFETIELINGTTGETLWTNTDPTDSVYALDLADFNNDAILDVAAGSWDNTIYVINGATGEILWTNTDPTDDITVLDIADFTQDAIPDIVAGSRDENVYFVNGANGETLYINSDPESNIAALAVADFNTDGTPDVAAASRWWDGLYFINGATGETLWTNIESWGLRTLAIGDFNKDSTPDVVVGASETINFVNGATGETLWTNYEPRESIVALTVADFTQDSIPDVVAGSEDTNIYRVNGATRETLWTNTEPTDDITALAVGDFNNDAIPDVVAGSEDSNVYILDSDHVGPILQYCRLPIIPTSIKPLDFQLIYDEPNLDTILMSYYSDGEINIITPSLITANRIDFSIPAVQNNPLAFWFWANDTWGNRRIQGNETNSYQLPISLHRPWINTDPSYAIDTLAVEDFNNDTILDIVAGAENIYFIDGATEQILYQNYAWCLTLVVGDFNADSIPDVAVADFENIYFIDGFTGTTLYQNSDPQDSVYVLAMADFNQDTIPDIAAGSWDTNIYFIDGATGITLYSNTEPTGWVEALVIGDFNQDSIPDVAAATDEQDTCIYFIDGATGKTLRTNIEPIDYINTLDVGDFNNDSIPDIVGGSIDGDVNFIDGATGKTLYKNTDPTEADWWIEALMAGDINNDAIPDVIAGSRDGVVYIINGASGKTIFTTHLEGFIEDSRFALGDVTRDQVPDVIVTTKNPEALSIIDGRTGKIKETIPLELGVPATSNLLVADLDQNGFLDIGVGQSNGHITVIQPLSSMYNLFLSSDPPLVTISQGEHSNFLVNLRDAFGRSVANAMVTLLAKKVGTDTFVSYLSNDLENGSYSFSLATADWWIGEWEFYFEASHSLYNDLDIEAYMDINGQILPPSKKLGIIGEALPQFILISETGPFANGSQVVEGENITLQINLQDSYYHSLSQEDASILVSFYGPHVLASFVEGRFKTELSTRGLKHGFYEIGVSIWGPHLNKAQRLLIVEVIPRFPTMEFSPLLLLIVAGVAFLILIFLMRGVKSIQASLKTSPDAVLQSSRRMIYTIALFLAGTFVGGILLFFRNPIYSFLFILVAFGEILLLYFVWFFTLIYKRVTKFEEKGFSIKAWLSMVIFSGLVAFPIALSFLIGSQIEWFDYYIRQELTNLIVITIPSLYWEIGIVSFGSGFLLVILNAIWRTKISIERLKEKKEEVEREYKEPNIKMEPALANEIAYTSSASFNSMLRSFFIWYAIVLFTFFITFQLFAYIRLAASVAIPAGSTLVIAVRNQIRDLVKRR